MSQLKQACASPDSGLAQREKREETLLSGPRMYEKIHNYIIMGVLKSESRFFSPACGHCLRPITLCHKIFEVRMEVRMLSST